MIDICHIEHHKAHPESGREEELCCHEESPSSRFCCHPEFSRCWESRFSRLRCRFSLILSRFCQTEERVHNFSFFPKSLSKSDLLSCKFSLLRDISRFSKLSPRPESVLSDTSAGLTPSTWGVIIIVIIILKVLIISTWAVIIILFAIILKVFIIMVVIILKVRIMFIIIVINRWAPGPS